MMKTFTSTSFIVFTISLGVLFFSKGVLTTYASPYFYSTTGSSAEVDTIKTIPIYLYTDGQTVTAAQTVLNYSATYLTGSSYNTVLSRCSFWAPANPSLGYGNSSTPYFHGGNKAVISCGFSNPGYTSSGASGDLIATLKFNPEASGSTSLTFSNTSFRYIASTVTAGNSPAIDLTIGAATDSGDLTPTALPTAVSEASSSGSGSDSGSSNNSNITVNTDPEDTLTVDDLEFEDISGNSTKNTTTTGDGSGVTLEEVDEDNLIPAPPANITRRPKPTPYTFVEGGTGAASSSASNQDDGDVLSVSSLRELLIPGKSSADKTVVMVNFISTLTFIALLSVAIWRMITISRMNKVKYRHMQNVLTGELSALQSKLGTLENSKAEGNTEAIKESFDQLLSSIKKEPDDV